MIPVILTTIDDATDQAFMLQLYNTYQRLMMATALEYAKDTVMAEDIVHDSIIRLMGKIHVMRPLETNALAGYIATTVRNTAIDRMRREAVILRHSADMPSEGVPDAELTLDELMEISEHRDRLLAIWPKLSEDDRLVLEGKYILGYTDRELAEMLGCREVTVRVKLTRARKKCSQLLGKEAAEHEE